MMVGLLDWKNPMPSIGAVVISRNDNYGGDLVNKFKYTLSSLLLNLDQVYYIDWNSPETTLIDEVRTHIPKTGRLHSIVITNEMARELTNNDPDVQFCVEVLARNIGLRRLNTDYLISTNSDIYLVNRDNLLDNITDNSTFYTVARTETAFNNGDFSLDGSQHASGSPLGPRDPWSLITCPGDFQLAHRNVWYGIKGFEEAMMYKGYADSNVQRKADFYGFKLKLVREIKVLHFSHYPGSGSTGGNSARWNSDSYLFDFQGTSNPDTWGFSDIEFEEEVI